MNLRHRVSLWMVVCALALLGGAANRLIAQSASPSGTQVPPATMIVDSSLAQWTIAADGRILRNGVQAANGWGSSILWSNGQILVFGTDSRWYAWTGSSWQVQTSSPMSPSGTRVPPAPNIVDSTGGTWTIAADLRILRNGQHISWGYGSIIDWTNNTISVLGTDARWYRWTGSVWALTTAPAASPSPSGTRVPPAPSILDASGGTWTIASDLRILRNGEHAAWGYGSIIDWTNNAITVLGTDNRWYAWTGSAWNLMSSTPSLVTSPNQTEAPPASGIVDNSLATWTVGSGQRILRDGVHTANGYGSSIYWWNSVIYVLGTDSRWWQWTGSAWTLYGSTKPGVSGGGGGGGTPTGDAYVQPGQSIQTALDSAAEGATVVLQPGVHRMQSVRPKNSQTLVGASGAVMSGARLLTSFGRSGSAWYATGQTQEGAGVGECRSASPRCNRPEDLFVDDVRLRHVGSMGEGGPGRWYFDYGADTIYFWDDPTGRRVEASVTPWAVGGTATHVKVRSIVIEKYANPAQTGAVRGGTNWVVEGNVVQLNHGSGIELASYRQVLGNTVKSNGQLGASGTGSGALVEGNEISFNNAAGYNPYWEAGGTKFTRTSDLIARGNYVHHNDGPGLHFDIDNINLLVENNRVEENSLTGIFHEIGYRATIRNNTSSRNGQARPDPYWVDGAGILIYSASDVEVYGNTIVDNWQGITALHANRGGGAYGTWTLRNLYVHDNNITQSGSTPGGSSRTGLEDATGENAFTSWNNRFVNNRYTLGSNAQYFFWMHQNLNEAGWRSYGQDTGGSFIR